MIDVIVRTGFAALAAAGFCTGRTISLDRAESPIPSTALAVIRWMPLDRATVNDVPAPRMPSMSLLHVTDGGPWSGSFTFAVNSNLLVQAANTCAERTPIKMIGGVPPSARITAA